MNEHVWETVDQFVTATIARESAMLASVRLRAEQASVPEIHVTQPQGKFLALLVQICGARTVLEVGTLAGYSTLWMGAALPADGQLLSLEANAAYCELARENVLAAGLDDRIEVRHGMALEILPELADDARTPFDFVFLDANKAESVEYVQCVLPLARPGTVIVADNVVRGGSLVDDQDSGAATVGVRRLHEFVASTPNLEATTLQTVGSKGHDGMLIARVLDGRSF